MCWGTHGPRMENVNSNGRFGWKNTCLEKLCHRVDFEFHRQSKDQTGELECLHMPRASGSCFLTSGAQPTGLCHEEYVGGGEVVKAEEHCPRWFLFTCRPPTV